MGRMGPATATRPLIEILRLQRIVLDHVSAPRVRFTAMFEDLDGRTKITFRRLAVPGNEQNFHRLAAHLVYPESDGFWASRAQGWCGGCARNQNSPDFRRKSGISMDMLHSNSDWVAQSFNEP